MKRYGLSLVICFALCFQGTVYAHNSLTITGHVPGKLPLYNSSHEQIGEKIIALNKLLLSDAARHYLKSRTVHNAQQLNTLPDAFQLGMHGLAPLDQGVHATAVTFAISAALNAATSDKIPNPAYFVSELCSLELGNYLHSNDKNYPSGWNGSWSTIVLNQIKQHGIVMMKYQKFPGCAGMTEYPTNDADNEGNSMSDRDYHRLAQHPYPDLTWRSLYNLNEAMKNPIHQNDVTNSIKQALYHGNGDGSGHRVLVAFLLDPSVGGVGALGTLHTTFDSWIMTPEIIAHANEGRLYVGHEAIITGYDDQAEITAPDGSKHRGVFTLRNAWGALAGDHGNFYMSYDYLQQLALDVIELIP